MKDNGGANEALVHTYICRNGITTVFILRTRAIPPRHYVSRLDVSVTDQPGIASRLSSLW